MPERTAPPTRSGHASNRCGGGQADSRVRRATGRCRLGTPNTSLQRSHQRRQWSSRRPCILAFTDRRGGAPLTDTFGGVAFLLDGKMFVGIVKDELMVRVGPDAHEAALGEPHARTMDFTGRPMRGYVFVAPAGYAEDPVLRQWVDRGLAHVETLSARPPARTSAKKLAVKRTGAKRTT